jgi:hypothetical protein
MSHGKLPVKSLPHHFNDPDGQYKQKTSNRSSAHPAAFLNECFDYGPEMRKRLELE